MQQITRAPQPRAKRGPSGDGGDKSVRELAIETGIAESTIRSRIKAAAGIPTRKTSELSELTALVKQLADAQLAMTRLLPQSVTAPEKPIAITVNLKEPKQPEPDEEPDAYGEDGYLGTGDEYEDSLFGTGTLRPVLIGRRPSRTPKKVLALGCSHLHPAIARQTVRVMTLAGLHAVRFKPDNLVHLGDLVDWASVAKKTTWGEAPKPSNRQDLNNAIANLRALNAPIIAAGVQTARHYCKGNHDVLTTNFKGADPKREGSLNNLFENALADAGFTFSDYGEYYWLGNVGYVHIPLTIMSQPVGGSSGAPENIVSADSTRDTVFAHTHRWGASRNLKLDGKIVTALNVGSSQPEFYCGEYAQLGQGRKQSYGIMEITDFDGSIQSHRFVTLRELEALYGREADRLVGEI